MEKLDGDYLVDGGDLTFNFCKFATYPGKVETFAYLTSEEITGEGEEEVEVEVHQVLTSNAVVPQEKKVDENSQLTTTYISDELCEDETYWSFSTTFVCDEQITG